MSANGSGKKQCVACQKSGGILICGGCERAFCGKHSIEHRQALNYQLDEIIQEHDLIQQELVQMSSENSSFTDINKWEKESIAKIQSIATTVRVELQQVLDRSKMKISKICRDIAENLRSSREADDFSEQDLNQWMDQLKDLKTQLNSPLPVKLVEDQNSSIPLIRIENVSSPSKETRRNPIVSVAKDLSKERFSPLKGPIQCEENGTVIQHIGSSVDYIDILGEELYSHGRRTVRLRIQYSQTFYNTFLGCISPRAIDRKVHFSSTFAAGWFGHNQIYQHGLIKDNAYDCSQFRNNDILRLTFDCDKRRIELHHERTNTNNQLQIDTSKAPLPWRLLVVLCRPKDCLRILSNDRET